VDVWVDQKSGMPTRIVTANADGQSTQTAELKNINVDAHLTDNDFTLPPTGADWDVVEEPFRQ
jgi:outer membrane lipoprotein-sorting protein